MANEVKKCTIISGAPNDNIEFLKNNIDMQSYIIAADSGYQRLLSIGVMPNLIIGDFDSSQKPDIDCEIIEHIKEKTYTDTFNCVRYAVECGYNDITIFFAIGSRFDHTYSNVLILDYCRKWGVSCVILDDRNRLSLITDKMVFKGDYHNFSLFAYLEDCKGIKIKGAGYTAGYYGLDSLDISLSDQFAQSNYVKDDVCEISIEKGTLLLVESND